jgi:shikimate 5-dehydrogenase
VNATPVGSDPRSSETPVPPHCLRSNVVVFDVVYPHTTQLLRDAAKAGCKTVGGLSMFLNQAYEQLKIWLPADYRRGVEQEELEKEFYKLMGGP